MSNDRLLQNVVSILIMAGYNVSERCEIRPRSFDLMTSDGKHLLVIKVVSQIDSVNEDIAWDLDKIARGRRAAARLCLAGWSLREHRCGPAS